MAQFVHIVTQPDNIPIIGMIILVLVCLGLATKQAFVNDRLIETGRKDRMYQKMYE